MNWYTKNSCKKSRKLISKMRYLMSLPISERFTSRNKTTVVKIEIIILRWKGRLTMRIIMWMLLRPTVKTRAMFRTKCSPRWAISAFLQIFIIIIWKTRAQNLRKVVKSSFRRTKSKGWWTPRTTGAWGRKLLTSSFTTSKTGSKLTKITWWSTQNDS